MTTEPLAFITGATGFVGAAVARTLLDKGFKLRALSRPNNDRRNIEGLDLDVVEGDLGNAESYRSALKGCTALFHVAADYRIWVPDAAAMHRINVEGTHDLMTAAQDAGVSRIVYTSSVAALATATTGAVHDEASPVTFANMIGTYKKSKYLAEEAVKRLIQNNKLPAVIVNPSMPIGPRDIKPTPTGRLIVEAAKGAMPAYVDTGLNVVHVEDVAMGHFQAYERGTIGERYILGGENLALGQILEIVASVSGKPAPKVKLPIAPLFPVAWIAEGVAHFTKKEPFVTADALRMARKKMFFSIKKAESELGYTARPAREALTDAYHWFKQNGYC